MDALSIRCPNVKRWLFGKLALRSSDQPTNVSNKVQSGGIGGVDISGKGQEMPDVTFGRAAQASALTGHGGRRVFSPCGAWIGGLGVRLALTGQAPRPSGISPIFRCFVGTLRAEPPTTTTQRKPMLSLRLSGALLLR